MYLASAPPHRQFGDEQAWETIQHIISDQKLMIDKIADYVEALDGTPNMGEFPMEFTGFHDLSTEFSLQRALERQKREAALIDQIAAETTVLIDAPQSGSGVLLAKKNGLFGKLFGLFGK